MTLALRYAARSDVGLVRSGNEDSGYAGPRLLVVADGMGGHAAGELASAAAVARLAELEQADPSPDGVLSGLTHAIEQAGASIGQVVQDNPDLAGMGTTVTALFWQGERVAVVHVGDSRAYLLRDGELGQITHDHTYVQTLVDAGRISAEEAAHHPRRSLLMRAIDGVQPVEADLSVREARAGDRYLLCSDGLTGVVTDQELAAVLSDGEPTGVVITLVELALSRGAPDNVTVVVADVLQGESDWQSGGAPVVVGAAGEPRVRSRLPNIRFPDDAQPDPNRPEPPPPVSGPPTSEIPSIDAPIPVEASSGGLSPRARRTIRIVVTVAAVLSVIAGALTALGAIWWSNQWYVGADAGRVTVFQGVPGSLGAIRLQRVTEVTDTEVAQLPIFDAELVERGIAADSVTDAQRIAEEMALRAAKCQRPRPPAGCPTVEIDQ
jgi:serine/threonine protein phosphatase PrpC